MFSPYYRRAWRRGGARAEDHCAVNVCLYGPGANRWTMTERGARHLHRGPQEYRLGPSQWSWDGQGLTITLDEIANPLPRRVRGTVRVQPSALCAWSTALDDAGRHRWGPIAPCARIEVALESPGLRWAGHAYVDSNEGDEPVTAAFSSWDWLRAPLPDGSTAVVYDVRPHRGLPVRQVAARFAPDGSVQPLPPVPSHPLPQTGWRIARQVGGEPGGAAPVVLRTLEDTPFYARSLVRTTLAGHAVEAVHETLSADRFATPWVQALLPWRMPRRG